ncbi:MAG: hypothetical protein CMK82_09990 [Pseudomonadales bacterium]|nr:hypothetical protein [Pseudomonadales bacterium]
MHTASQALAIERQASAQPSLAERVSRPKTRAILGLMRLNFLSVASARSCSSAHHSSIGMRSKRLASSSLRRTTVLRIPSASMNRLTRLVVRAKTWAPVAIKTPVGTRCQKTIRGSQEPGHRFNDNFAHSQNNRVRNL